MLAFAAITVALAVAVFALRHSRGGNVALALLSLSVCFTALEAYYRYIFCESDGFGRLSRNFAARYYRLDEYGLRSSNLPLSRTQGNVVVLGDSHVFGAGLRDPRERFSEHIGAHFPQLHVINLGLPGWDTRTEIEKLAHYIDPQAGRVRLVVLGYFFNDIEEDVEPGDTARIHPMAAAPAPTVADTALQSLSNYSRFVELYYYRLGYPRLVRERLDLIQAYYRDEGVVQRHMQTLEKLRLLVQERYGADLLLVVLPFLHSEALLNDRAFYDRFLRRVSDAGFHYIDMQPVFAPHGARKLVANRFDPHPNAFANELVAHAVEPQIRTMIDAAAPPAAEP